MSQARLDIPAPPCFSVFLAAVRGLIHRPAQGLGRFRVTAGMGEGQGPFACLRQRCSQEAPGNSENIADALGYEFVVHHRKKQKAGGMTDMLPLRGLAHAAKIKGS